MSAIGLDNDTILQFNKGDESAFTVIYNHFYHHIFAFCKYLLPLSSYGKKKKRCIHTHIYELFYF
jgi:hypothetical protein